MEFAFTSFFFYIYDPILAYPRYLVPQVFYINHGLYLRENYELIERIAAVLANIILYRPNEDILISSRNFQILLKFEAFRKNLGDR